MLLLIAKIYGIASLIVFIAGWLIARHQNRCEGTVVKALAGQPNEPTTYGLIAGIAIFWPIAIIMFAIAAIVDILNRPV